MSCESYKDALNSAAAGAPATSALRSHLIVCAECRAALAAEENLLAGIDAGLRFVANAPVPPSLIPSVRVRLQEPAPRPRWIVPSLFPAAAAVLLAMVVAHQFRWFTPKPSNPGPTASVSPPTQPVYSEAPSLAAHPPEQQSARIGAAVASRGSSAPRLSLGRDPSETIAEILVPRDQEALLADYARQWRSHGAIVLASAQLSDASLKPMEVVPIQIDLLDVKPLADEASR
jgi:hypothetical protein